jgi:polyisoprenoid-binding protein YceI
MNWLTRLCYATAGLALIAATNANQSVIPMDAAKSKITVFVYKEGLFAFAADNHEVSTPIASGSFDQTSKTVDLTIDATKMQVQDPPSRRDQVQANMLGPQVLDVAKYPQIAFHSTKIEAADPDHWTVTGDLTLHGQTRPVTFQVLKTDASTFSGSATVRQTDFGISPIKIAGGAVRVKNDVKVEFTIVLGQPNP